MSFLDNLNGFMFEAFNKSKKKGGIRVLESKIMKAENKNKEEKIK